MSPCCQEPLGYEWTNRVGKAWSAYNGSVRTFLPGLNFATDDPYRHPLAKLDNIVLWEYDGILSRKRLYSEEGFQEFLREKMFHLVTSRQLKQEETLFYRFAKIQSLSSKTELSEISGQVEEDLRLQIDELKAELDQVRGETSFAYDHAAKLEEEIQRLNRERFSLCARLDAIVYKEGQRIREEIPIPSSLEELESWQEHTAGQLVVAPRALKSAVKSIFSDPPLAYRALLLLANEYRHMRIHGGETTQAAYQDGLRKLQLKDGRSISEARSGEQGDEYFLAHPIRSEKRIFLAEHLKRGNSRDPRNILRIYFAWDQEDQIVIVGWLPGHLETRES